MVHKFLWLVGLSSNFASKNTHGRVHFRGEQKICFFKINYLSFLPKGSVIIQNHLGVEGQICSFQDSYQNLTGGFLLAIGGLRYIQSFLCVKYCKIKIKTSWINHRGIHQKLHDMRQSLKSWWGGPPKQALSSGSRPPDPCCPYLPSLYPGATHLKGQRVGAKQRNIHVATDPENTWISMCLLKKKIQKLLSKHQIQEESTRKATLTPEPGHDSSASTELALAVRNFAFYMDMVGTTLNGRNLTLLKYSLFVLLLNICWHKKHLPNLILSLGPQFLPFGRMVWMKRKTPNGY